MTKLGKTLGKHGEFRMKALTNANAKWKCLLYLNVIIPIQIADKFCSYFTNMLNRWLTKSRKFAVSHILPKRKLSHYLFTMNYKRRDYWNIQIISTGKRSWFRRDKYEYHQTMYHHYLFSVDSHCQPITFHWRCAWQD